MKAGNGAISGGEIGVRCVRIAFLVVGASSGAVSGAHAQAPAPLNIPLQLVNVTGGVLPEQWRLSINVGIGNGDAKPYLFDTGSPLFNAQYNSSWWPGFSGDPVPASTVANGTGAQFCYGNGIGGCRGFQGNIVQVKELNFYSTPSLPGVTQPPVATLTANPGYQINAVYNSFYEGIATPVAGTSAPMLENRFFGVFGAGAFTSLLNTGYTAGSVLGQTTVASASQGYVVAANGSQNPFSELGNPPLQPLGQSVKIGGTAQPVTDCSPCVTLGLTPQMLGQFAPVRQPSPGDVVGMVPWTNTATAFPDPYGTGKGNPASHQFGVRFQVAITPYGGGATVTTTTEALLDTGTGGLTLASVFNQPDLAHDGAIKGGSTLTAIGVTGPVGNTTPVVGLEPSTSILQPAGTVPINYLASFDGHTPGTTNTLGLSFFLQNSVLFDLQNRAVGYTPFFVTDASLVTTPAAALTVTGESVPLGLAGVISGGGSMTIENGAAVQLSATNTYTGETKIAAGSGDLARGKLLISGPGSIASSSGVTNDGILDISRAWARVSIQSLSGNGLVSLGGQNLTITNANGSFAGTLSDGGYYPGTGGSLTIAGGHQTLSGHNFHTGGTTVSAGTLSLTGTMIGNLDIAAGATFTTTGGYSVASGATLANAGTFQSIGAALFNQGNVLNSGTLTSDLINAGSFTNNGVLTGALLNLGSLSGTGTINGAMTNDGSLAVNGLINGNLTSNGRLSGTGTINGIVTNNAIVAPGNSIGTLNVTGSYTQAPGSSYQVEVNAAGQSDLINVTGVPGTATINGGMVNVLPASGVYAPSTTYTILSASGGVTGAYAGVGTPLPFLRSLLAYDANNVYLTLKPGGFAMGGLTSNQTAVGGALDRGVAGASGDFATVVGTMAGYTLAQGQAAMTTLSGQGYSGFGTANLGGGLLFMNALGQQMSMVRGGAGGQVSRMALAQACDTACDGDQPGPWSLWGTAMGGTGTVAGNSNAASLTYNAGGFATGLDYRFDPRFLAGVGVGFSSGNQWASGFSGQGTTNSYQASLYASFTQDAFYLDGLAGYGYNDNQMTRQIVLPNLAARTAQGRTGANQFLGQVEAGYRIGIYEPAALSITPFARFQGMTNSQNGFTESGAGALSLNVAAQTTGSARSVLGAEFAGAFGAEGREKLAVQMRLGWAHEYADTTRPVTAAFAGAPGTNFTVFGAAPQRDTATLSLAANTAVAQGISLYARYDGEVGSGISNHALNGGLRVSW